jgi:hypothetical protein
MNGEWETESGKMKKTHSIILFNQKQIRRFYDEDKELWYFSIVDVIEILTDSENPAVYWRVLKKRLKDEGSDQTVTKCNGLKMLAADGKMRLTDAADTEVLLRLIQSIPSPKAEPFKLWLAKVGYERIEETEDPELTFDRAMKTYLRKGYSKEWVNQRLKSIERIHKANLINFAVLPVEFENPGDYEKINADDELEVKNLNDAIKSADFIVVKDKTSGFEFKCSIKLSGRDREILLAGGLLNFTKS